ncbi:outer membrane beta-barrel protein [Dyadobacter aurulentus]|uniref:outer membrane beta-barrel protein n=1 Tax=Dyadobacter sp. UC 10 TaxID=2605428 RepID=UPI0011F381D1|nr:outer membrane beta-barrel protein [Dyadobacter sp. UC 10]KAA0990781.1 PorT family protein [Dyadobacter sp. UC 10]
MDPSGINNFEEQWRKALSEASETPPKSIWENIEAHLDEESEKGTVLPLWWQSKKLWLAAASVAALLVVGAGFWYSDIKNSGSERAEIAADRSAATPQIAKGPASDQSIPADQEKNNVIAENAGKDEAAHSEHVSATKNEVLAAGKSGRNADKNYAASSVNQFKPEKAVAKSDRRATRETSANEPVIALSQNQQNNPANLPAVILADNQNKIASQEDAAENTISVNMLAGRSYNDLDIHLQKRYVFFKPNAISEEEIKPKKHTEYWAGIGVMPASFNPDVQIKRPPQDFAYQALSSRKAVTGTSEAGVSYALQTQGGVRLSKHWSVELGLSYLQGNSSYEGGGYLLNAYSQSANVLENAFADASPKPSFPTDKNFNNGAVYIDVAKKVSNNYQYLQMPVQAGFTLNPDKKLSYSILGGMMANFFLSNDLESASGDIITTKASDEVYRSMNWAATTGLRFNYRLSSRWKANLTGSYQKAISSGFRSNQTLDAHPYLYGVAWGVRYSF